MWLRGHTLGWDAMHESWGDLRFGLTALSKGYFPFWNHLERGGYPFFADPQTAVLYPVNWLLYLLGVIFGAGPSLSVMRAIFHYLISAIGCQLLAKKWGASTTLSLFFAMSYTFSGRLLKSKDNAGLWTMVWLPWLMWSIDRLIDSPRRSTSAMFALILSLAFYAGYPPNLARSLLLIFAWLIYRVIKKVKKCNQEVRSNEIKKLALSLSFSGALTVGLCSPGIISTAQVLSDSERSSLGLGQILSSRMQLSDLIDFLLPRLVHADSYALMYCGLATLIIAIGVRKRVTELRGERIFWLSTLLLTTLWSCGRHTPILKFFALYVPSFNLWRIAEQYAFLSSFSLASLALIGGLQLESMYQEKDRQDTHRLNVDFSKDRQSLRFLCPSLWKSAVAISLVICITLLIAYLNGEGSVSHVSYSFLIALVCVLSLLYPWTKVSHFWLLLSLLTVVDVGTQQQPLVKLSQPIPNLARDHLLKIAPNQRFADKDFLHWRPASRLDRPELLGRYSTMVSKRWARYRSESAQHHSLYEWGSVQQLFSRAKKPIHFAHSAPYAYWTEHEKQLSSAESILEEMKKSRPKDGVVAWTESSVNSQLEVTPTKRATIVSLKNAQESVRVVKAEWGRIELMVRAPTSGILVVNESFSPKWLARIDSDQWIKPIRVNYLFQGLRISEGSHRVEFIYWEGETIIALFMAFLTLLYTLYSIRFTPLSSLELSHSIQANSTT